MSNQEKYEAAKRELAMRMRVYPKWVDSGRMTQDRAEHEIAVMKAIMEDYRAMIKPSLFDNQKG